MNSVAVDYKIVKIIPKFFLGEAKLTKKSNIFTTVVLMYFRLFLPNDLFRGQIEGWATIFWLDIIKQALFNVIMHNFDDLNVTDE